MIAEIPAACLHAFAASFPGPQLEMVVASVVAGNTSARLWTIGDRIALLWDQGNNVFYLSGEPPDAAAVAAIAGLVGGPVREFALTHRLAYFKARPLSVALTEILPDLFPGLPLYPTRKLFFTLGTSFPGEPSNPAGVRLLPIDRGLLARTDLENAGRIRAEVEWMWPSLERFHQHGFGQAALCDGKLVCWCTAEYVSRALCGIGIETLPEYRRRGIATATACGFARQCRQRGIAPHWECDQENGASVRVAEKVGFKRMEESIFWAGRFLP